MKNLSSMLKLRWVQNNDGGSDKVNIIVCVKQVPSAEKVKLDEHTNTIIRDGTAAVINPVDLNALEEGLRIKERKGAGKVTAISMGIPSAVSILKYAISSGADEGILLSDKAFAGSDTLATAYVLAKGIDKLGSYDLIICGKQSVDGDTGQVGPSLSERLGIPCLTNVHKVDLINEGTIRCQRFTEYGCEVIDMELPALISVNKGINEPRIPTVKGSILAARSKIIMWNEIDICAEPKYYGLAGSPTRVVKTFKQSYSMRGKLFEGSPKEQADALIEELMKSNIIQI